MAHRSRGRGSQARHSALFRTRHRERGSTRNNNETPARSRLNPTAREWNRNSANMNNYMKEINEVRMPNSERNARNINQYLKNINVERSRGGATRRRSRRH